MPGGKQDLGGFMRKAEVTITRSRDMHVQSAVASILHLTDDHDQQDLSQAGMLSSRPASLLQENTDFSHFAVTKTPGRALKGRAGLQENVLHNGSMTANPREKKVTLRTPFHQGPSKTILQDAQSSLKLATLSSVRPLGDKTPKPNRQSLLLFTPGPRSLNPSKLALSPLQDELETTSPPRPPSLTRTKLRSPRPSQCFETPVTKGDYWNVSDVSIEQGTTTLSGTNEVPANELDEESEPEYMPPKPIEIPYEPPFELPNYREVGQTLLDLAYAYPADDPPRVYQIDSEDLLKGCDWSPTQMRLDLPEFDEDDIFVTRVPAQQTSARKTTSSAVPGKRTVSRPLLRPAVESRGGSVYSSRPATSLAIRAPDPRPVSTIPRPGTSMSSSRPLIPRPSSKSQSRVVSNTNGGTGKRIDRENMLALQITNELEAENDFRFDV